MEKPIEKLKHDPFVLQNNFLTLTLEQISERLEKLEAEIVEKDNSMEPLTEESLSYRDAFQHFKELYVQVLFEIESINPGLMQGPVLQDIAEQTPSAEPDPEIVIQPIELSTMTQEQPLPVLTKFKPVTEEYLTIATYFETASDASSPLTQDKRTKIASQNLCFAMESECVEKLTQPIRSLWSDREKILKNVLDHENKKFQIHPAIKEGLQEIAKDAFPFANFVNSLRFFLTLTDIEQYTPNLLDSALFILLFGQERSFGKVTTQNCLKGSGLSSDEIIELAATLVKLHKTKIELLSVGSFSKEIDVTLIKEQIQVGFRLLEKYQVG